MNASVAGSNSKARSVQVALEQAPCAAWGISDGARAYGLLLRELGRSALGAGESKPGKAGRERTRATPR